jgi:drug/metabolite transporter (DMT)-like permease
LGLLDLRTRLNAAFGAEDARYRLTGIALAVAAITGFAVRPGLIKLAYVDLPDPVTLLALRMAFSLPFFALAAVWVRSDRRATRISWRDGLAIAGLGALGYYLASYLDFLGLQYVSAGIGRLLLFIYPTIVVVLGALFLGRQVSRREFAALVLTYCGLGLVVSGAVGDNANLPLGAALIFGAAFAYAIYLVAGTEIINRVGSVRFTAYALSASSLMAIGQFLLLRPVSALVVPTRVYFLAIAMAAVSTVVPIFFTAEALRRIGANQVSLIGALGPVLAIFFGYLTLGESMGGIEFAGAALVILGVAVVSMRARAAPIAKSG